MRSHNRRGSPDSSSRSITFDDSADSGKFGLRSPSSSSSRQSEGLNFDANKQQLPAFLLPSSLPKSSPLSRNTKLEPIADAAGTSPQESQRELVQASIQRVSALGQ